MSGNIRNKKRRMAGSTGLSRESTVNEILHSRVLRSSGKLVTFPSHAVVTTDPLTLTSSEALSPEIDSPSEEISYSVNKGKKRKSNIPERVGVDSSNIIHSHRLSYDRKLLDALNSETSREALMLLTSKNIFTQEGLNQALISACRQGHKQLVQTLVRVGADIEHRDEHGNTPLLICADNGFTDILQFLVSRHANINAVNSVGNTALILSIRSAGCTDLTRFLLKQQDVDIQLENQHGDTALLRATQFLDVDTMRLLLQKSMSRKTVQTYGVCYSINKKKKFSFHSSRSQEVRQQFKVRKTGLRAVYKILQDHLTTQTSPLELAIKAGDRKSLDIFLDCQFSSVEEKKRFIDCALKCMFENHGHKSGDKFSSTDVEIIHKLLHYGADVSLCDGLRLISLALESGNIQLVELLCTHGTDLKKSQSNQQDPVCLAATNIRRDIIELLLKYKADVSSSDFCKSPLYSALRNDHSECAKLLIQSGAKMNVNKISKTIINKKRNKKQRLSGSTDIPHESTVNEMSHSRVFRSSGKLVTFPSHAGVTPEPLTLTSSEALLPQPNNSSEISYSANTGKKRKFTMPERAGDDCSDISHCHRPSYDGKLLGAIKSKTSREAMKLLTSENTFTQEGLDQALISSCRRGHKQLVQTLVRAGANIEHQDEHGNTPLLICAENGFTDIVRFLVSRYANINAVNSVGNTALILSVCSAGSTHLTRFLLEQEDVDIHIENQHGHTALLRATQFMDVDTMRLLLQKSMKRKTVQTYGYLCMIRLEKDFSFHKSRSQQVRQQFKVNKIGLRAVYRILQDHLTNQTSPLELAIKAGDTKSLDIFLDCQFSSVEEKKRFIDCALKYVFENHGRKSGEKFSSADVEIIQKLLHYGADVNLHNRPRLISLALESGNIQLVELMCTYGTDLKKSQPNQQDPVCKAANNFRRDIIELLLEYKADVSISDFCKLPLYCALTIDHMECSKLLIHSGAEMNVKKLSENVHEQRNKKQLSSSTAIPHKSTVNEMSQSLVLRSSGKLVPLPSHAVVTTDPLTLTSSGALSPEMDNPSETSYLVNTGKKRKSNMPERAGNDSSDINNSHGLSYDGKLLDAINSETLPEAMALLTSENSFTQEELNQSLISACRQGHKLLVQTLVRVGADIEHRDEHRNTPLLISAENGFIDIVRFLVSRHANVNAVNSVGNTALILSVRPAGSTELTRCLLEQQDVDIHHENQHGDTALLRATQLMDVDTMRFLLQKSMKRNTVQISGDISVIRQEKDFSFRKSKSQEVRQQIKVRKTGLRAVYRILQDHLTTHTSPLELAIKAGDTKSLDIFLDCQFSSVEEKKGFIDCALKYVFQNHRFKSVEGYSSTDVKIIQKLLQYGADVDPCDGPRLISLAVRSGNMQLVELLCTHGADLEKTNPSQEDPVCVAAENGRRDLIELLLKYKADVSTSDFVKSPLYYALTNDHIECAELLIQSGAKMNVECALRSAIYNQMPKSFYFVQNCNQEAMDYFSQYPLEARKLLTLAARYGNCEIIGYILDAGVGINEADLFGKTPLMASKNGEVAEFLIHRGADVNREVKNRNGIETVLSHMLVNGELSDASTVELCKVLIDHGAAVSYRNGEDKTPLMLAACLANCVSMLQMLLKNGADVNDKDSKGNTALFHAVMGQRSKNVTCLIDSARDKNSLIIIQNDDGSTPLMVSVQTGNVPIVKELIENGADVNVKDNKENSALHHLLITCPENREEILTCLLEAGSHVNCQNSDGLSPLMLAAKKVMVSLISPLLDSGADVNAVSKRNTSLTALSFLPGDVVYNAVSCIETLMNKGANCSYLNYECFHKLIIQNRVSLIPKLIQSGLGPAVIETNKINLRTFRSAIRVVSPFVVALLFNQVQLARYFVDILFLTRSDLSMIGSNMAIAGLLHVEGRDDSLNLLHELSLRPMTLVKLCLVTVSAAVGPCPGWETKVDSLPLPQVMKDRLLFKSLADEHAALTEMSLKSNNVGCRAVTVSSLWGPFNYMDSSDDDYY